jgi:hypothetical protein
MREDLKYPDFEAAKSVLSKIGVNTEIRINHNDQDFEYTSCSLSELSQYINLYSEPLTTDHEKRVLGCYFMQCLNDHIQEHKSEHPLQVAALNLMFSAPEIHEHEINYWSNVRSSNQENSWPITKFLVNRKST